MIKDVLNELVISSIKNRYKLIIYHGTIIL
jgi:hypothetical protein